MPTNAAASGAGGRLRAAWRRQAPRLGAVACLLCCVFAVLDALFRDTGFDRLSVAFLVLYIAAQPFNVLRSQWTMALLLITAGLVLAAWHHSLLAALWEGGRGTLMFILLFASVTLLQYPALRSPSMQVVRAFVVNLPPARRYLWLSLASHFLSAITNFAGFALLASFVAGSAAGSLRKRMALALSRGFVAASAWSPFFLAMAVVVSLMPKLRWLDVAAPGLTIGLLLIVFGSLCDWVGARGAFNEPPSAPVAIEGKNLALLRLGLLSAILVGGVAALDAVAHLSMSATIAIVVTIFSLGWFWILAARRQPLEPGVTIREYASTLVDNVSGLRGLSILFIAANIFGQGVAATVDGQLLVDAASHVGIAGVWWVPFLFGVIAVGSFFGLHAVILIVVIGHTLPAETIGLSQPALALVMLSSWGIGGVLSPLSNLTLYAANMLGQSNWRLAWRDNGIYALGCLAIASLVIMTFHWLTGGA